MAPNNLQMRCSKCRVADHCPKAGQSPYTMSGGKQILCQIIGGYGRVPIDDSKISEESMKIANVNGKCLTLAEVPTTDSESGVFHFELVKIWHKPILNEREVLSDLQSSVYPKAYSNK